MKSNIIRNILILMVLNKWIPVNCINTENISINQLYDILNNEIYNIEKGKNEKEVIDNILKKYKLMFSNYFWYLIMDDDFCTHFKKDTYCCKRNKKNSKNYLCCEHNPDHIKTIKLKDKISDELHMDIKINCNINKIVTKINTKLNIKIKNENLENV